MGIKALKPKGVDVSSRWTRIKLQALSQRTLSGPCHRLCTMEKSTDLGGGPGKSLRERMEGSQRQVGRLD